ncbi:MAG: cell division protein FtsA [Candidatus Pacebacteria bacterium]|mgnify:CR=1 FL=1|nr:cell division protein FtsA [Candidatus Paceibacterota bacterium]
MPARRNFIVGIDLGSSNTKGVVGEVLSNLPLQIVASSLIPASGIRKGLVVDFDEATDSVLKVIEDLEQKIGSSIKEVIVGINGSHIQSLETRGVVAVSRADGEVSRQDVERVLEAARTISLPQNKEIIHLIPKSYILDQERDIKNPIGMHGIRLEVEALAILGSSPYIKNSEKIFDMMGVNVEGINFSTLSGCEAAISKRQKELGILGIDIGGNTTGICVFEDGNLIHTKVLPIGAMHITNDIAIAFQLPIDSAEKLKLKYGLALNEKTNKNNIFKEKIDLADIGGDEGRIIQRKELIEVIEARLQEIFEFVNKELKSINRERLLPAGVTIFGGGAKMSGIDEFAKEYLKLPSQIGYPRNIEGIVEKIDDPSFTTVIGLLISNFEEEHFSINKQRTTTKVSGTFSRIKKWFEELMP